MRLDTTYLESNSNQNTHKMFSQTSFPTVWGKIKTLKLSLLINAIQQFVLSCICMYYRHLHKEINGEKYHSDYVETTIFQPSIPRRDSRTCNWKWRKLGILRALIT